MGDRSRGQWQERPSPQTIPPEVQKRLDESAKKILELTGRVGELEKAVNDKNEWNNVVRGWIGTEVIVTFTDTKAYLQGILKGLDRYTLCVHGPFRNTPFDEKTRERDVIIHKGAIAYICQT
jgi:hypothetical protein